MGPSTEVTTWNQFYVNGYNFHTQSYGRNKSTMNYGVCVESQGGGDYFGTLEEVLQLSYHGSDADYKTVLFNCRWFDCDKGMNIHEKYRLVEVNHSRTLSWYDPFIVSYQASQVYYAPYPSLKRDKSQWWAVFKTKARSEVDAPVDSDVLQEATSLVPVGLCSPDEIPDYEVIQGDDDEDEEVIPSLDEDDDDGGQELNDDEIDDMVDDDDEDVDDIGLFH